MVDEGPHPICFYKNLFDSLHSQWLFLTAPPIHSGWISSSSNPIPPRAVYCQWPFLQAHPRWMKGPHPIWTPKSLYGSLCSQWQFHANFSALRAFLVHYVPNGHFWPWIAVLVGWIFQKAPINKIYICHIYLESKKIYSKVGLHADSQYQYW
jgi:hypothetical protein